MLHSVILAGGSGTRFWPQSRRQLPKQFLHLSGPETLIQSTWSRCRQLVAPDQSWVVTGGSLVAETARQLPEIPGEQILAEPCPRSTAPGLALAAMHLLQVDPDAVMLVLPADQVIEPAEEFVLAVRQAERFIKSAPEAFVLFGATATRPSTRYGFIQHGDEMATGGARTFRVAGFQEKPTMLEAARYAATGNYSWNCGILVTRADTLLRSLAQLSPELHQGIAVLRRVRRPHLGTVAAGAVRGAAGPGDRSGSARAGRACLRAGSDVFLGRCRHLAGPGQTSAARQRRQLQRWPGLRCRN